ncbi:MAG: MSMEG_0569 family flavin-dependent oxidoreductase [Methylomarinum sp.]|nr:MSMEG_0569 family flavin-dependent oxidoreductase [Methylomarinum sp.]
MNNHHENNHQTHYQTIIIGGGQAGLSVSYYLKKLNISHIIFEKNQVAHSWSNDRWDSFCLVTPNWQSRLPDFPYQGNDPQGFMLKDEIVDYVKAFAKKVDAPISEGVAVTAVRKSGQGGFEVSTSVGEFTADHVVVATGGYDIPIIPDYAKNLPSHINQIHSVQYKNPQDLPDGEVLVVGTGQSGVQLMEDLHLAGRKVHLAVGSAPRSPRMYRGRETTEWLYDMEHYQLTLANHPLGNDVRKKTNHYLTGRDGGHEIDLRKFAQEGVQLYGSISNISDTTLEFQADLSRNLDEADEVYLNIRKAIDDYILDNHIDAPVEPPFRKVWEPKIAPLTVDTDQAGISSIVWAIGFRPDYSWIELPCFDDYGHPQFLRGVSNVEGLYFIGLPWLNTWGSGRFLGIAEDSQYLAEVIQAMLST